MWSRLRICSWLSRFIHPAQVHFWRHLMLVFVVVANLILKSKFKNKFYKKWLTNEQTKLVFENIFLRARVVKLFLRARTVTNFLSKQYFTIYNLQHYTIINFIYTIYNSQQSFVIFLLYNSFNDFIFSVVFTFGICCWFGLDILIVTFATYSKKLKK